MYRVSVCYAAGEGKTFDMEYYKTKHKQIVFDCFPDLDRMEIDQGVDGPFLAVGHLYFPSMEALQQNMGGPRVGEAQEDVKNFTNVEPSIQVSEIIE